MLTPPGVIVLLFGVFLIGESFITNDSTNVPFGATLLLFSYLFYEMNWKFDNLKDILKSSNKERRNLNQRGKKE